MHSYVALLRAVNVGGASRAPSAALKAAAEGIWLQDVQVILQTGNLVFRAPDQPKALEARLEQAFTAAVGLKTEVMVRSAAQWAAVIADNPFPGEAKTDPGHLLVVALKGVPKPEGVEALKACPGPEVIEARGRELYIVYPYGIGRSKLNGHSGWKKLGCAGTGRNWNTVLKLADRLG